MAQWVRKVLAMQAEVHEFDPKNLCKGGKRELAGLSWPLSLSLSHLPSLSPSPPHTSITESASSSFIHCVYIFL